jgi:hypothetical protein
MRGRADDAGPNIPDPAISPLADAILALLEEAGAPTELNNQVVRLVEAWEYSLLPAEPPEQPVPDEPELANP